MAKKAKAVKAKAVKAKKAKAVALSITLKGNELVFTGCIKKRFTHHGFGTFLEKYDPAEVEITNEARSALLRQKYRSGLQGAEFFNGNVIAWGAPTLNIEVPLNAVSVHPGADSLIRAFATKE